MRKIKNLCALFPWASECQTFAKFLSCLNKSLHIAFSSHSPQECLELRQVDLVMQRPLMYYGSSLRRKEVL